MGNKNKIIVQGNKPKILLCEQSKNVGGVSIEEGILLAKQYVRKIIEMNSQRNGKINRDKVKKFGVKGKCEWGRLWRRFEW